MSKWSDFYKNRCNASYMEYALQRYRPFIEEILFNEPLLILEEGCGVGTISKCLMALDPSISPILSDICPDQIELAYANTGLMPMQNCIVTGTNAPPDSDIVIGHGVLEHFPDREIESIINRQWDIASKVVHYVPTDKYKRPSFGDERLLSVAYWLGFQPTRHFTFNDDHDLCLIWESTNEPIHRSSRDGGLLRA